MLTPINVNQLNNKTKYILKNHNLFSLFSSSRCCLFVNKVLSFNYFSLFNQILFISVFSLVYPEILINERPLCNHVKCLDHKLLI